MIDIGIDIDGVIADFPQAVLDRARRMGLSRYFPATTADIDRWHMSDHFSEVMQDAWMDKQFWLSIPVLEQSADPSVWGFEPACYITSRPIDSDTTELWLALNGFPAAPVITVSQPQDKLRVAQERGLNCFIDDLHETVEHFINNGQKGILFASPFHKGHDVGHLPTIKRLEEIHEFTSAD